MIWQLFPSYLLITILSLFAVSWYASNSMRHFFLEHTASDLQARGLLVEKQVAPFLEPLDRRSVDLTCKAIGRPTSTRITVSLPDGEVIGDSEEGQVDRSNYENLPEIDRAAQGHTGRSIRHSQFEKKSIMYVAIPVMLDNQVKAIVRTAMPVTAIEDQHKVIQTRLALGGILVSMLAAGISLFVSRRITRPIENLKQGAECFSEGNFSYRMPVPQSEEIASLAEAMNQMARQLRERIQTIMNQRNELETVLSNMKEGVIAVDRSERITSINAAAARMFNNDVAGLQGRMIQEVVRNPNMQRFIASALRTGEPVEGDIILYDREERVLQSYSTSLRNASQDPIGTLVVLEDVTKLRQLENMRRDFVANVSHEIKTPLTAIKGFVETLSQLSVDNPEENQRFLAIILKHVDRLNCLVQDLLALSKIEQEGQGETLKYEKGRIEEVIRTAIQVCQGKADAKRIAIEFHCPEEINTRFDPPLLEQAAVNLLDNAINYSNTDSTIHVSVDSTDDEIVICFRDHGIGIPKKDLPRIFERFYRVDKARSRKVGGTGLGLAIVKHIVKAHGGYVTVDSIPGQGSTFGIHLPAGDRPISLQ